MIEFESQKLLGVFVNLNSLKYVILLNLTQEFVLFINYIQLMKYIRED